MEKWYDSEGKDQDVVVASRIRLSRNLADHRFPCTLTDEENIELTGEIENTLKGLSTVTNHKYQTCHLNKMSEIERMALAEKAIINKSLARRSQPVCAMIAEDESIDIIINGDDHLRIQVSIAGNNLDGAWKKVDQIDDFINERYEYAYDERYGYLTTFPTNLGTGMKAYLVMHLPYLSSVRRFPGLVAQMSRFGVQLKGAVGAGEENYGGLFVAYNQTTLGQSEESKIAKINSVCSQLIKQERIMRQQSCDEYFNERKDQAYKAYGLLKYARRLTLEDAMEHLSIIRTAAYDGCIEIKNANTLYNLMVSCLPSHIQLFLGSTPADIDEDDGRILEMRARYVRTHLPELISKEKGEKTSE